MKSLSEIKHTIGFKQSDENFINYLKILNLNGVVVFNDSDVSEIDGEMFASEYLYDRILSVYGTAQDNEEMIID